MNLILAVSSKGRTWFQVNHGNNNSSTFLSFILRVCSSLQEFEKDWRLKCRFLVDNAQYHCSELVFRKLEELKIPFHLQGVYSWETAPCEKIFAQIKQKDLNPGLKTFECRISKAKYHSWIGEEVFKLDLGCPRKLYSHAVEHALYHLCLRDV